MIELRKSCRRGLADHGWLKSRHSFSFADYWEPSRMGWGNLRVINEDRIAPGTGFGAHGHRDMEIVSVVLEGELAHRDNMGNGTVIKPGEVQHMSAGRGVMHSEFNHAEAAQTHFLQIWLLPQQTGIAPAYHQRAFGLDETRGRLRLACAPQAEAEAAGALGFNADARLYLGRFRAGDTAALDLDPARKAYVHLALGRLRVNGVDLDAGDALALEGEGRLALDTELGPWQPDPRAPADAPPPADEALVLVFDLAR